MNNNSNTIIVLGATGMLGQEVVRQLSGKGLNVLRATYPDQPGGAVKLNITDEKEINRLLNEVRPQALINCCAWTDVDGAETNEPAATAVNGTGVGYLAQACKQYGARLVHVSTDYVFDGKGTRPYLPTDPTGPAGAYGRSKLAGEQAIKQAGGQWIIIRTSWLFGAGGKNFVDTIVNIARQKESIKVVNDQHGCPTWTVELARCLVDLAGSEAQGIYHFCNPPACTWYDLAWEAVKVAGVSCQVNPCATAEFPRPAPRPAWSVLDCVSTFALLGWKARSWQEAVYLHLKGP